MFADSLATELDDRGVSFVDALRAFAMLDDVDDFGRHADLQSFRLVRRPFEPAVHFAGDGKDRDFAHLRIEAGLKAQMRVQRIVRVHRAGAVEMNAGGPAQADNGLARRRGAVVSALAGLVEVLALEQWQAESGLQVDV